MPAGAGGVRLQGSIYSGPARPARPLTAGYKGPAHSKQHGQTQRHSIPTLMTRMSDTNAKGPRRGDLRAHPPCRFAPLLALLIAALLTVAPGAASAAARYTKQVEGREVLMVVPDRQPDAVPLIIALHGCGQTPAGFVDAAALDMLVDRGGAALAVPAAPLGGDNPLACWPWWDPANQRRDGPEPRFVMAVIDAMDIRVDTARVHALGFSAGGAMAAILGTVYPDVLAAIGIHSGIGFAAAGSTSCALKIMRGGAENPGPRGELAYLHQPVHRIVPTMIIHGREDAVVDPGHADALVREIARRNDLIDDDTDNGSFDARPDAASGDTGPCPPDNSASCHAHRVSHFEDAQGNVVLTRIMVEQLGHAWSGGRSGHRYADPGGPDAGAMFGAFFAAHQLDPGLLREAGPRECRDWWAPPWWHYTWAGTMTYSEYTCDMNPWSMVWRHRINGIPGPGPCP